MKAKPITLAEVVRTISKLTEIPRRKVKEVLVEYETIIASELLDKGIVKLGLLGKMKLRLRSQRIAMDLKTNERIIVPAKVLPKFTFSKAIKDLVTENISVEQFEQIK